MHTGWPRSSAWAPLSRAYISREAPRNIEALTHLDSVKAMHNFPLAVVATLASVGLVSAHGYVPEIKISGKSYPGYNPYIDPFDPDASPKIFRKIPWNGPTEDVTSKDLQCGGRSGTGTSPAPLHALVEAGSHIELYWTAWPDSHHGPVITYMAKCPGKCDDYQPGSE